MKLNIDSGILSYLAEELTENFDYDIIQRGYNYYYQSYVISVDKAASSIHAKVSGSESDPYSIVLDLDFFGISSCSCPYVGYCKHLSAVLFKIFEIEGKRPELIMQDIDNHHAAQHQSKQRAQFNKQKAEQKAWSNLLYERKQQRPLSKSIQSVKLSEHSSNGDWHRFIINLVTDHAIISEYSLQQLLKNIEQEITNYARSWNPVLRQLFELQVYLFMIIQIDNYTRKSTMHYNFDIPVYHKNYQICINHIEEILTQIDVKNAQTTYPSYTKGIIEILKAGSFDLQHSIVNWLHIYRLLWWELLNVDDWQTEELARLNQLPHMKKLDTYNRDTLNCLLAHFNIMAAGDKLAMESISQQEHFTSPKYWLDYAYQFIKNKDWQRAVAWLKWMKANTAKADLQELKSYFKCWEYLDQVYPVKQQLTQTMIGLLPRSYPHYSDYLLHNKQYTDWADVTMTMGVSIFNFYDDELLTIEKSNPQVLIPLYHQAVERCILEKNREAYRDAVYALKKLRKYYLNSGKQQRWEQYIQALRDKHPRLRAFQEELKKGKLIS